MVQVSALPVKLPPSLYAGLSSGAESLELQHLHNIGKAALCGRCDNLLPDMPARRLSACAACL